MDLLSLPTLTYLSDNVTIVEKDEVKIVRVIHDKATAAIALHGAHVLSYIPAGKEDLIWMSSNTPFDGKAALRGGIPVCWPWFGKIAEPGHGFARISQWKLAEHRENEQGVVVVLELEESEETLAIWPYKFKTRLFVEVGDELKVTLEVNNTDEKAWTFSSALHTYLNVGDVAQITTTGMGAEYIDKLQDSKICQGDETLVLTDTIDRVYTMPESKITVTDPVLKRALLVENSGHNCAVLWNPWSQGSKAMADMPDDGYKTMFCVESTIHAPCLSAGQTLQPGEQYLLATTISAN
ncbi:D-hexose-6-phosphate mutarotase [Vibrio plantisponsor]|uniref:Putative glucose-6-phosphate 1-epimerase n=1 Tax=Vibrio plantisponsor TaxID=664643 RepID=A0ABU4IG41_9VIBR|nr:D-hexose-6-phosphate mutarotase [Vibrio plantisponsor]MDW6016515.1 D-hexose-6-phosphate mutarotase [Vibrio plantisponsor]NNM41710.1 D-hexose-6-phosphate mutarotase [Vibrio plantisponsor]PNH90225.1 D-hexose-6-phosphate mutarotase [Vibrio diazotrophicus]